MKVIVILLALVAIGSCAQIRRIIKAPYNRQPAKIEVEQEVEVTVAPVSSYSQASQSDLKEEEVKAPVRSPLPIPRPRQPVAAPTRKELEEEQLREAEEEKIVQEQNRNAKYSFGAAVDDGIMDHSHVREEQREGNKVTGSYSYSDGYVKRTVKYVADENGYRVISEESEDIGDGPNVDMKNGKADIHTHYEGVQTKYSINADEISQPEASTAEPEQELKEEKKGSRRNNNNDHYNSQG